MSPPILAGTVPALALALAAHLGVATPETGGTPARPPAITAPAPDTVAFGVVSARIATGPAVLLVDGRRRSRAAVRRGRVTFRVAARLVGHHTVAVRDGAGRTSRPVRAWLLGRSAAITGPPLATATRDEALERRLAGALRGATSAPAGAVVVDLARARGATANAGARFQAASTLKVAIAIAVLARGDVPAGSPRADLLRRMLVDSDNAAANALIDAVGGPATVDATLRTLGLTRSYFVDRYYEQVALRPDVTAEPALRTAKATTPWDLARLVTMVHARALDGGGPLRAVLPGRAGRRAAGRILALLLDSSDRTRAVAGWPGVPAAHKSGTNDQVQADAGIWYAAGGPVVVAAMVASADATAVRSAAAVARSFAAAQAGER